MRHRDPPRRLLHGEAADTLCLLEPFAVRTMHALAASGCASGARSALGLLHVLTHASEHGELELTLEPPGLAAMPVSNRADRAVFPRIVEDAL